MLRRLFSLGFCCLGLIFASSAAFAATSISLTADKPSITYGQYFRLTLHVVSDVTTCPGFGTYGLVTLEHDGVTVPSSYGWFSYHTSTTCANGVFTTDLLTDDYDLLFGTHVVTVTYTAPGSTASPVRSNSLALTVNPGSSALTDAGVVAAGIINPRPGYSNWYCTASSVQVHAANDVPPPPGTAFAPGEVEYQASGCYFECGFLCPAGTPTQPQQRVLVQMPQPIQPGAKFWFYSTGPGTTAGWQPIDAQVNGAMATLLPTGGSRQSVLSGYIAMSANAPVPNVQDMWWSGPAENGWGLSIAQNGGDLFVALYTYRDDGTPEWFVLPLGSWDAQAHSYSGMLYDPKGSWFGQYDASRFDAGDAVGHATLTFSSDSSATLDYTIRGTSGRKSIVRLPFGSTATPPVQGQRAGLWWAGSAHTGWGLAIGHQGNTLFSVWYTYAKDGTPTWYVMPGGTWSATDTYTGALYRTTGKSWLSGAYDPAALKVAPVGTMTLHFTGPATADMAYSVDGVSGKESISVQPF